MTPNERARHLISATTALIGVIRQENGALAERRHAEIEALQTEKQVSADAYETQLRALVQAAPAADAFDQATRRALEESRAAFETAARENVNALRSAIELNNRLVRTIAASVERQRVSPAGYTKSGASCADATGRGTTDTLPASLDETF